MFLSTLTEQGAAPALEKMMAFQEARLKMIAENIANAQTPGYRARQLDVAGFQRSLREALDTRQSPAEPFVVRSGEEVRTDVRGNLVVSPSQAPAENVLFHDDTNLSMEQQMSDLAQAGLWSDMAARLLQTRNDRIRSAIRGSV
jgi:flagellar basal-body rod protein FlgB